MRNTLTQKQRIFCLEYCKSGNGQNSAIAAGYSPTSAKTTAAEILTYPTVQQEIARLNASLEAEIKKEAIASKKRIAEIASEIVENSQNETTRLKAGHLLSQLFGYYAPQKREISGEVIHSFVIGQGYSPLELHNGDIPQLPSPPAG